MNSPISSGASSVGSEPGIRMRSSLPSATTAECIVDVRRRPAWLVHSQMWVEGMDDVSFVSEVSGSRGRELATGDGGNGIAEI